MWFYDEDGKAYQMQDDRSEYLRAIQSMDQSDKKIKIEKETLLRAREISNKYQSKEKLK